MTPPPPPLSNYPRAHPREPSSRLWPADVAFGILGILATLAAVTRTIPATLAMRDGPERTINLVLYALITALLCWLRVLVIYRRRLPIAILLTLSVIGLTFSVSRGLANGFRHPLDAASNILDIAYIPYLALRLFGKLGPRPR